MRARTTVLVNNLCELAIFSKTLGIMRGTALPLGIPPPRQVDYLTGLAVSRSNRPGKRMARDQSPATGPESIFKPIMEGDLFCPPSSLRIS